MIPVSIIKLRNFILLIVTGYHCSLCCVLCLVLATLLQFAVWSDDYVHKVRVCKMAQVLGQVVAASV
jgi:hypothetical protein